MPKTTVPPKVVLNLKLEKPLLDDLDSHARRTGLSRAELVRYALRRYCQEADAAIRRNDARIQDHQDSQS